MAVVDDVFLDTSVLVAGLIELGEKNQAAQQILDAVADERLENVKTAWHCCLEFFSVTTRLPAELRLSPADALLLVEQEILARFEIHDLPPEDQLSFFQGAVSDGVAGGRIYDAHIAGVARAAGAKLVVTENRRHFITSLRHGMAVLTAKEFVEEAGRGQQPPEPQGADEGNAN